MAVRSKLFRYNENRSLRLTHTRIQALTLQFGAKEKKGNNSTDENSEGRVKNNITRYRLVTRDLDTGGSSHVVGGSVVKRVPMIS